jgi:plasmid stabilization system protein ParE
MTPYELVPEAQTDLFDIWSYIARDSVDLANRVESELYELFTSTLAFGALHINDRHDRRRLR